MPLPPFNPKEDQNMSVMKWRKRPVVVEAVQYIGDNAAEVIAFCEGNADYPNDPSNRSLLITTKEGVMEAIPGDYIIRGVAGEFYPCKSPIFEATYDPVQDDGKEKNT
jgi:hypothetical protein